MSHTPCTLPGPGITAPAAEGDAPAPVPEAGALPGAVERLSDDTGATTAEYAITTLAACGFAAVLVVLLKSGEVRDLLMGIITAALSLGS